MQHYCGFPRRHNLGGDERNDERRKRVTLHGTSGPRHVTRPAVYRWNLVPIALAREHGNAVLTLERAYRKAIVIRSITGMIDTRDQTNVIDVVRNIGDRRHWWHNSQIVPSHDNAF